MNKISYIGPIPENIREKSERILKRKIVRSNGWRKLSDMHDCFSFRLNNNYRILLVDGICIISCHDIYEKLLKRKKAGNKF